LAFFSAIPTQNWLKNANNNILIQEFHNVTRNYVKDTGFSNIIKSNNELIKYVAAAGTKVAKRFILNSEHNIYTTGSKGVRLLLYRVYLGTQHIGPGPTGSFCSTAFCI
jgi:hypothetical protein